jgi:hypothetical protein
MEVHQSGLGPPTTRSRSPADHPNDPTIGIRGTFTFVVSKAGSMPTRYYVSAYESGIETRTRNDFEVPPPGRDALGACVLTDNDICQEQTWENCSSNNRECHNARRVSSLPAAFTRAVDHLRERDCHKALSGPPRSAPRDARSVNERLTRFGHEAGHIDSAVSSRQRLEALSKIASFRAGDWQSVVDVQF